MNAQGTHASPQALGLDHSLVERNAGGLTTARAPVAFPNNNRISHYNEASIGGSIGKVWYGVTDVAQ